ncbi:hypothetical protein KW807_02695, partial [Candidatus Parcubacteria bacterium]|nr:hypothetical protein [Candidatus Parcubacteria bacterium]
MKIVSTGSTLFSSEQYEKKLKAKRRRLIITSIIIVAILVGAVFVSRLRALRIHEVNVVGASVVSPEKIKEVVKDVISGYYLWLIPRDNALLYPRSSIKEFLTRKFPRLNSIDLSVEGLERLNITVTEREPFALYCASALAPEDAHSCYFLDQSGFIFDQAPAFSGTVYFIYALEEPYLEPQGKQYLSIEEFKPLSTFINNLPALGLEPLALELGDKETNLVLAHGARIVWKRGDDLSHL